MDKTVCFQQAFQDMERVARFGRVINEYLTSEVVLKHHPQNVMVGLFRLTDINLPGYEREVKKLVPILKSIENSPEMPTEVKARTIKNAAYKLIAQIQEENIRQGLKILDDCLGGIVHSYKNEACTILTKEPVSKVL